MGVSDADLARLYQLPPAEFVAERNALAKRAGADGADIRALPKPTLAVWAVNQLHWQEPDIYRALVESAENLRATHKAVIAGGRGDLRAAGREHEAALDSALKATLAIAAAGGTPPSDAVRQTIASTLRALPAGDPPGRLRQALTPGGFEVLAGLPAGGRVVRAVTPAAGKPSAKAQKAETTARKGNAREPERTVDKAALARAKKAVAAAERTLAAAEQAARREEFEAARAAREAEQAERRTARAREALKAAESDLEEAEEDAAAAKKKRDGARSRAAAAETEAAAARQQKASAEREVRDIEAGS